MDWLEQWSNIKFSQDSVQWTKSVLVWGVWISYQIQEPWVWRTTHVLCDLWHCGMRSVFNDCVNCWDYMSVTDEWVWSIGGMMSMGKSKCLEKILSQCHFVHPKSHMDWPGIKPGPLWWEAGDILPKSWHILQNEDIVRQVQEVMCSKNYHIIQLQRTLDFVCSCHSLHHQYLKMYHLYQHNVPRMVIQKQCDACMRFIGYLINTQNCPKTLGHEMQHFLKIPTPPCGNHCCYQGPEHPAGSLTSKDDVGKSFLTGRACCITDSFLRALCSIRRCLCLISLAHQ
jgi:hypothetical protein